MSDEHWYLDDAGNRRTWWIGPAVGGPLDGSEIRVEAAPMIPMQGMQVTVCVGDDVETAEWHVYSLTPAAYDAETGVTSRFTHLGTLEGDPKPPR